MNAHLKIPGALALVLMATLAWAAPPQPPRASMPATQTEEQARTEAAETERRMEATPAERRAELQALMRTADRRAQQRIDAMQRDFERNWSKLDATSRDRARDALQAARRERTKFQREMARLNADSAAAWIDVRSGVIAAYRDLAYALATARREFARPTTDEAGNAPRKNDQEEGGR